ncbi:hypothetical protein LguiA_013154 [Lonicera macranthoides]
MLLLQDYRKFIWYDITTERNVTVEIDGMPNRFDSRVSLESLVQPRGGVESAEESGRKFHKTDKTLGVGRVQARVFILRMPLCIIFKGKNKGFETHLNWRRVRWSDKITDPAGISGTSTFCIGPFSTAMIFPVLTAPILRYAATFSAEFMQERVRMKEDRWGDERTEMKKVGWWLEMGRNKMLLVD